ncbi:hypothetical protein BGW39_007235 [Mortierella sp. 14UC]|nr:hypothetical protein BGW39_007235 [Mortierella sp. 14UC]
MTAPPPNKNPLLLPEVLDRVAYFVHSCNGDYYDYEPSVMLPCLLVCRLWHDCFLPHLYDIFISGETDDGAPFYSHIRHLRTFVALGSLSEEELPYNSKTGPLPSQLTTLRVHQDAQDMLDLLLANAGSQLRTLTWMSSKFLLEMPSPMVKAIASLSGLVSLELDNWKICRSDLLDVLAACSSTLEMLSLRLIAGYGDAPFIASSISTDCSSTTTTITAMSCSSIASSTTTIQPPRMERLSELRLVLDWHQSPAAVHLIQLCPSLRSLYLNVDVETSDWSALIANLRTFCPRLESIEYEVGYSMEYEWGCYIKPHVYASLLRDSTVEGQLKRVVLGLRLDGLIAEALLKHAETLEEVTLALRDFGPEQAVMLGGLFARCRRLRKVEIEDIGEDCEVECLKELMGMPWVCRELKSLAIIGYNPCRDKDEEQDNAGLKKKGGRSRRIRSSVEEEKKKAMFAETGQGWFTRPGLRGEGLEEAAEDRVVKQLLMEHMKSSGIEHAERLQFNDTEFYSDERHWDGELEGGEGEEEEEEEE